MKKVIDGVPSSVFGMLSDLMLKIQHGTINPKQLEDFLKRKNPFVTPPELTREWQKFYQDVFGLSVDLSTVKIPKPRRGFDRLIIVAQGMTPERLFNKGKELFPSQKWTDEDLDKITISERTAKDRPYAIWVRDRVEADEELKNLSANDIKTRKITTETFEERLVYELKYFKETGKHLDINNITLCAGSRFSDGFVPDVSWSVDELRVDWYGPGNADGGLRSRQAVS